MLSGLVTDARNCDTISTCNLQAPDTGVLLLYNRHMICLDGCPWRVPSFIPRLGQQAIAALGKLLQRDDASVMYVLDIRRVIRGAQADPSTN